MRPVADLSPGQQQVAFHSFLPPILIVLRIVPPTSASDKSRPVFGFARPRSNVLPLPCIDVGKAGMPIPGCDMGRRGVRYMAPDLQQWLEYASVPRQLRTFPTIADSFRAPTSDSVMAGRGPIHDFLSTGTASRKRLTFADYDG